LRWPAIDFLKRAGGESSSHPYARRRGSPSVRSSPELSKSLRSARTGPVTHLPPLQARA